MFISLQNYKRELLVKERMILGALLGLSNSVVAARLSSDCGVFANMYLLLNYLRL